MPNPFSITAASDSVRLDSQERGSMSFTVSNTSGRSRRGRARLVPADPGQASWLSLEGEAERDFTADGTHQFTVRIAVPHGTPAGRHTFGLDLVSVENPDEEWSQGPKVAFEVPAPPPRKPFPWWIVAVAGAVLLVGGLVAWLMSRGDGNPAQQDEPVKPPVQASGVLGTCRKDGDCGPNLTCAVDTPGQPGICVGKVGFSPCGSNRACAEGLVCDGGTCQATKVVETPTPRDAIQVDFDRIQFDRNRPDIDVVPVVQTSGVLGTCRKEGDCDSNLTCAVDTPGQPGICVGKVGFSPCGSNRACAEGLVCDGGTCQAAKPPAAQDIVIPAKNYASAQNCNVGYYAPDVVGCRYVPTYLEYDISFPKGGTYELWVEYASSDSSPMVISFDSRTIQQQGLAGTTGGDYLEHLKWRFQCIVQADAGTHLLRLAREKGSPQLIRSIKFVPRLP